MTTSIAFGGIVDLEKFDDGSYDAKVHPGGGVHRAYGGSVLANVIAALSDNVGHGRGLHSLHMYFLRPVHTEVPLHLTPRVLRDGANYSARQIDGSQTTERGDKQVLTAIASFKDATPGEYERQADMPDVPSASTPESGFEHDRHATHSVFPQTLEFRNIAPERGKGTGELTRQSWIRLRQPLGDAPGAPESGLAYISDLTLTPTARLRFKGGEAPPMVIASIDHAMWFHKPWDGQGWVLYDQRSRSERDGRTWARGDLWAQDGTLLASVAQEALFVLSPAGATTYA